MFKKSITVALFMFGLLSLNSCREEVVEKETVVREVESEEPDVEVEVEEEDKGILERTGEEIDQEVNNEIDEEIDKIGDDN